MQEPGKVRAAFLTPEYPTEAPGGGLAAYVRRMAQALTAQGHEAEVFVPSRHPAEVIIDRGIRVERTTINADIPRPLVDMFRSVSTLMRLGSVAECVRVARALSAALQRREATHRFDVVQSSDYSLPGLFVATQPGRAHVVRCSWAADLYYEADGISGLDARITRWLERRLLRRADAAYAPSDFIASHHRLRSGLNMRVLRPPALLETTPAAIAPAPLPPRYLVFFGRICHRKGTDTLAAALPLAWREAPDLAMVWAGPESLPGTVDRYRAIWGEREHQVSYLGVRPTAEVYAVVRAAEASVVPSIVDNLPNTVIESLLLAVPVIGSRGASIDELVEDEVSGLLVPISDPKALAAAMLRVWRHATPWQRSDFPVPERVSSLTPERAVREFVALAQQSHASGMIKGAR